MVVSKLLSSFFVSAESVSYPYGCGRKFEVTIAEVALLSLENYMGRFVFIPKVLGNLFFFFNNNRNILVLKCE